MSTFETLSLTGAALQSAQAALWAPALALTLGRSPRLRLGPLAAGSWLGFLGVACLPPTLALIAGVEGADALLPSAQHAAPLGALATGLGLAGGALARRQRSRQVTRAEESSVHDRAPARAQPRLTPQR